MSQKIYTDRTEVEGVELPSSGQTRVLVIDEHKKIQSEDNVAENTSYDNTTSGLDSENVQEAIDELRSLDLADFKNESLNRFIRLNETLVKLEENITFTVGVGKDFEVLEDAIDQALNFYPNADYKITILIDGGYEINNTITYQGLDFSHIILSTTGFIVSNCTGHTIRIERCWLPEINNFFMEKGINGSTALTGFYFGFSSSGLFTNSHVRGFQTCLWFEFTTNFRIRLSEIQPIEGASLRRGIRIQNSLIDISAVNINTNFDAEPYFDNEANTGIQLLSSSVVSIRSTGGTANISGEFKNAIRVAGTSMLSLAGTNFNIESVEENIILQKGVVSNGVGGVTGDSITANIPYNTTTSMGVIYRSEQPTPYDFNGTDYQLPFLKAPAGQEYNVVIDEDGKIKSEVKALTAYQVSYDNTDSGLDSENVQEAVDEVQGNVEQEASDRELAIVTAGFIEASGTTIAFNKWATYNSYDSPSSGNFSYDLTNPVIGMIQVAYHESNLVPTFSQAGLTVMITGEYQPDVVNKIAFELIALDRILINIKPL